MLVVDFLRHGELQGGIKYRGTLDEALTGNGRKQMEEVWAKVEQEVTMITCSPLSRCAQPAQAWAKEANIPLQLEQQIAELNYGLWEGLEAKQIQQQFPSQLEAWREDPTHLTPPQGESMQSFAKRTALFWQKLIQNHDDEHVLIVAHSGSIRLLLTHALAAPIKSTRHFAMPYACWSRVEISHKQQAQLVFHARV
ncbi:MAG TPA: cobalamin biosynthesis protein CobC [Ghiorsea sp.]|nr:cobalamin biosynthesis protein CobC [Ghiorsea sp.]HIP06592.1 cobalamin biosynthesis protein CobC [Mariprofundaceae bacterium]